MEHLCDSRGWTSRRRPRRPMSHRRNPSRAARARKNRRKGPAFRRCRDSRPAREHGESRRGCFRCLRPPNTIGPFGARAIAHNWQNGQPVPWPVFVLARRCRFRDFGPRRTGFVGYTDGSVWDVVCRAFPARTFIAPGAKLSCRTGGRKKAPDKRETRGATLPLRTIGDGLLFFPCAQAAPNEQNDGKITVNVEYRSPGCVARR